MAACQEIYKVGCSAIQGRDKKSSPRIAGRDELISPKAYFLLHVNGVSSSLGLFHVFRSVLFLQYIYVYDNGGSMDSGRAILDQ